MNPPPIGEALSVGWNTTKAHMVPLIIVTLCASLLCLIPVVGGFLAVAGLFYASLKAVRGQAPEPGDAFVGFQKFVDHLVIGLLQFVGFLACCIGIYVSQAVFNPGTFLILDRGLDWKQAKDRCLADAWPNWMAWTIFNFVVALVAGLGSLACIVGIFVTVPIATCAWAYAYEQTFAKS